MNLHDIKKFTRSLFVIFENLMDEDERKLQHKKEAERTTKSRMLNRYLAKRYFAKR